MKILVMSLLRIGDVAMAAPVLRDLRVKFGQEAQIDLLVNSQAASPPFNLQTMIVGTESKQPQRRI